MQHDNMEYDGKNCDKGQHSKYDASKQTQITAYAVLMKEKVDLVWQKIHRYVYIEPKSDYVCAIRSLKAAVNS